MRYKWFLLVVILFIQVSSIRGQQTMNLNLATISPSSYIINIVSPGLGVNAPTVDNTSQSVQYKWAESLVGAPYANITVKSTSSIPSGFTVTVKATGDTGANNRYGTGEVTVTVGTVEQNLISNIIGTNAAAPSDASVVKLADRPLVQNILISDFSIVHPGSYPVQIVYRLQ